MKARDEISIAEFFNKDGKLFSPALTSAWMRPNHVELNQGRLTIRSSRPDRGDAKSIRLVQAGPNLLESFLSLADASPKKIAAGALMKGMRRDPLSDERIHRFAARWGGLQIFYRLADSSHANETVHTEYCVTWRYFAGVMRSLLRIGAEQYQDQAGSKENWELISMPPSEMRETVASSETRLLDPVPLSDEENWLALTYYAAKKHQRKRVMLAHLLNTLLGLGRVRPWFTWPAAQRDNMRPQFTYASRSLLSNLALQLCLRIAKVDALLVCFHCRKTYTPTVRAPKTGQRNFCPDCREKGIPKYYAHRDFRRRAQAADC